MSDEALEKMKGRLSSKLKRSKSDKKVGFRDDVEMRAESSQIQYQEYEYTMTDSPNFTIHNDTQYQLFFNNQSLLDELNTRLLLMLPMVPKKHHTKIKLNHLKQYEIDEIRDG